MSVAITLETRMEAVEKELAALKAFVHQSDRERPWYEKTIGSMKDYPEFAEVVRLGRELRDSEQEAAGAAE